MKFEPSLHKPFLCLAAIFALAATKPAWAAEIAFEEGIEYANPDGQHLKLNMARPKNDAVCPAVICIHGGGFCARDRKGDDGLCKKMGEQGYGAGTVTYRLPPKFQFPPAGQGGKNPRPGRTAK